MSFLTRFLPKTLEGSVRAAAGLVFFGLLSAVPTLFWTHSLSFMAFAGISCSLTAAGVALYLFSLLRFLIHPATHDDAEGAKTRG